MPGSAAGAICRRGRDHARPGARRWLARTRSSRLTDNHRQGGGPAHLRQWQSARRRLSMRVRMQSPCRCQARLRAPGQLSGTARGFRLGRPASGTSAACRPALPAHRCRIWRSSRVCSIGMLRSPICGHCADTRPLSLLESVLDNAMNSLHHIVISALSPARHFHMIINHQRASTPRPQPMNCWPRKTGGGGKATPLSTWHTKFERTTFADTVLRLWHWRAIPMHADFDRPRRRHPNSA